MDNSLNLRDTLVTLVTVGAVVAIGKLLASSEPWSWRLAIGRTIVSAGLAVAAGSILAFVPGVSELGLIGLAAASAVLGEQFLERIIHSRAGNP